MFQEEVAFFETCSNELDLIILIGPNFRGELGNRSDLIMNNKDKVWLDGVVLFRTSSGRVQAVSFKKVPPNDHKALQSPLLSLQRQRERKLILLRISHPCYTRQQSGDGPSLAVGVREGSGDVNGRRS